MQAPDTSPVAGVAALSSNAPSDTSQITLAPCAITAAETFGTLKTPDIASGPDPPSGMSLIATPICWPMETGDPDRIVAPLLLA